MTKGSRLDAAALTIATELAGLPDPALGRAMRTATMSLRLRAGRFELQGGAGGREAWPPRSFQRRAPRHA
jgi:hypothetical protein